MDFEFELDFPVGGCEGYAAVEPACLRGLVGCEADVLVGADYGAAAVVPPAGLHVGVEEGLFLGCVS